MLAMDVVVEVRQGRGRIRIQAVRQLPQETSTTVFDDQTGHERWASHSYLVY